MLNNLKAEFVRKGLNPVQEIQRVTQLSEKSVRNKLQGISCFSIDEAIAVKQEFFAKDKFDYEYLFEESK